MAPRRDINTLIGLRAQAARKAKGLSQEELGRRLGLSKNGYGQYERGLHPFTAEQLVQMGAVLGQSVDYFIGEDPRLTEDEDRLLALYRHARSKGLADLLLRLAEAIADRKP